MATSNLLGQVKLYKFDNYESLTPENLEVAFEFKDHLFPINDMNFSQC